MHSAQHTCKNCGHRFPGKFCNNCGEKIYTESDKKLSHLAGEAFHFSTHFDNKFFRTLKLVFIKPGLVSKEFCEGRRKKYYSPFSLFLVAVFLYLLFPQLQGMNISFANHLRNNAVMGLNFQEKWAIAKAAAQHISLDQLAEKFDHLSPKIAKLLLTIIVPLCGLALKVVFRKRKRYFYDHFIFSSEFNSFFILYLFFLLPLVFGLVNIVIPVGNVGDDNALFITLQLALLWLVAGIGIKRFYGVTTFESIAGSLLYLLLHTFIIFFLYRSILFAVVMLFIW
jgi:hypothetical protein